MPTYEFFCEKCEKVVEKYLPINTRINFILCHKCGGKSKKIISNSTFVLKGGGVGWYADSYSKKEKK